MKNLVLVFLQIFILSLTFAQPAELMIKSGSKGFYLDHTVTAKEGLFPISRLYNVHPRHIANFNNLDFNKGLAIGQLINIPLTDTNFSQTGNKGVPVYYRTIYKESLMGISSKNNKVQLTDLRAWNNILDDQAPAGAKLIIGFLITNEMKDRVVVITDKKKETIAPPVEEKKS